ncbi:unnamed protein product [Vitrella brassicaformis CCMP3155]|uniref:Uncharacterized protein n=2 Tax=Vitrella brassicaformis TaxID=1169539 RepID=A0A0G4FYV4_VITBC|nr:unnamed protein product [Vitrella brassicaformis CCMP3155]|eukprot:CEM20408.1 unnamed protein product [Vitrella brassicaformis CCMP3155]
MTAIEPHLSRLPDDVGRELKGNLSAANCGVLRATSKCGGCHLISECYLTRHLDDAIHNQGLSGVLAYKKPPTTTLTFLLHFATAVCSGLSAGLAKLFPLIVLVAVVLLDLRPVAAATCRELTGGWSCEWLASWSRFLLASGVVIGGWWMLPGGSVMDTVFALQNASAAGRFVCGRVGCLVLVVAIRMVNWKESLADHVRGIFSGDRSGAVDRCVSLFASFFVYYNAALIVLPLVSNLVRGIKSEMPMGRAEYLLRLLHIIEGSGSWERTVQLIYYLKNSRIIPSLPIIVAPADLRQVGSRALFDSRPPAVRQLSLLIHRLVPGLCLHLQRTTNGQDDLGEWVGPGRQLLTFLPIEALMPAHLPFSGAARAAAAMKKGSEHLADAAKGTVMGCLGRQVRALAALPPEQLSMRILEFKGSLIGNADILSPYCPSCNEEEARVLDDMATLAALAERLDGQQRKALHQLLGAGGKDSVLFPLIHSANVKVKDAAAALKGTLTDEIATLSVYQSDPPTKRLNYIYSSFTDFILYLVAHAPTAPRPYKLTPDSFLSPSEQHQLAGKLRFALIHNVVLDCRKAHKADERAFDGLTRDNRDEAIVILCGERARDDFAASLWVVRRDYATCQTLSFEIFTTETPAGSKRCTQQRFPRTAALIRDKLEA